MSQTLFSLKSEYTITDEKFINMTKKIDFDGRIFFIGIGGIGMSALALFLSERGFCVAGSDKTQSKTTDRLTEKGIRVYIGHDKNNLELTDLVVYSSAISDDNEELKYGKENKIACISRARLLSLISDCFSVRIGVAGCHGKTTVTALLAHVLRAANFQFTAFIGGDDLVFGNYCNFGKTYLLSEVCEYKKNINLFNPDISVVLNIDNDHLDSYDGNILEIKKTFQNFIARSTLSVCPEHLSDEKSIVFGLQNGDYTARKIKLTDKGITFTANEHGKKLDVFKCKLRGECNVKNALAVIAVARTLKISVADIKKGFETFNGIARRDEIIGKINNATVIADYAHHPTQLLTRISDYKKLCNGRLIVVFQPHTYSRTAILFDDFVKVLADCDNLYLFKTYAAREKFIREGSALRLCKSIPKSLYFENFDDLFERLKKDVLPSDTVLILGAGNVYDKFKKMLN